LKQPKSKIFGISEENPVPASLNPKDSIMASDRVKQDELYHLRWDIFDDVNQIKVATETSGRKPSLSPFFSHPLASESIADPPVSRLEVRIQSLVEKHRYDKASQWRYTPPDPLIIEPTHSNYVTFYDFVTQVHWYMNAHKQEIITVKAELYGGLPDSGDDWQPTVINAPSKFGGKMPANTRFFFDNVDDVSAGGKIVLDVEIFAVGEDGRSAEEFWNDR
jgi:hypothetical protein